MKMKSKHLFDAIPAANPKSNLFDLSHDVKLSCQMGDLVPVLCMECVPGDNVRLACNSLLRLPPMVAPMMHRCDVYVHYWFVPNRLIWSGWRDYIAPRIDLAIPPAFPTITINGQNASDYPLVNYMGMPINTTAPYSGNNETISVLPFAAYQEIWYEYYRDQNMQDPGKIVVNDGNNNANSATWWAVLRKRAWEHDYFTSCLPTTQKGGYLNVPQGTYSDVPVLLKEPPQNVGDTSSVLTGTGQPSGLGDNVTVIYGTPVGTPAPTTDIYAKTSQLDTITIGELRLAERLQQLLEKFSRGGTRYIEVIRNIFNVNSSDARLQRPQYITGVKSPIIISEVLQTSKTDGTAAQGNMAGHGVGMVSAKYGSHFCEEHGYIIGIMSVLPKTAYQQGIPRHFLKTNDRYEFYWPDLAHIGEQAVTNNEIYGYQTPPANDATFGYNPRYSEYKYMPSRVAGDFASTLNHWHMGRIFSAPPALNEAFIVSDPTLRVFADTTPTTDHVWCHMEHRIYASRKMPVFGTPKLA